MSALCRLRQNLYPVHKKVIFRRCNNQKKGLHPETPAPGEFDIPPRKGKPVDKKPFPMTLEAGKKYAWCTCGESRQQPFCDGSHKKHLNQPRTLAMKGKFTPHRFEVTETKKYWLCMCKQTDNRPFCDGSHKAEEIQSKIKS